MTSTKATSPLRSATALLALLSFTSMACTTVHQVPTRELAKLDGFREDQRSLLNMIDPRVPAPPSYRLIDKDGQGHTFDASSRLVLELRTKGEEDEIEARYRAITVKPDLFIGLERGSSREIRAPLSQVQRAGLREFSVGKTVGLIAGIAGGALLTLIIISATLPSSNGGGGGGGIDFD